MRALLFVALVGCGSETHFGDDAGGSDASTQQDVTVASDASDGGPTFGDSSFDANADASCGFGSAGSFATQASLDLFGQTVFFADGGALPAGHYSIAYVDGCMMYSNQNQGWTVNAFTGDRWYLVDGANKQILSPPGTYGYIIDAGAYAVFADCVSANLQQDTPAEFDYDGGKLGLWLSDNPYSDNVAGENGRNPKWALTL
ncbi:MAG TPA: hypothetical protein VGH87_12660, partial [Polyangiaceae bacterium]